MHANKHSTYNSSYNTQTAVTQKRVLIVKGKQMLKSVAVKKILAANETKRDSTVCVGNFDFAGLAG